MKPLWTITLSTLKMLFRNKQSLFFTWLVPLLLMLVIGFVTKNGSTTISLGVVYNHDNTAAQQVVDALQKVEVLNISTGSTTEEKTQLQDNKRDLVLIFPDNFALTPSSTPTQLTVIENISKPIQTKIGQMVVTQFFNQMQQQISQTQPWFTFTTETESVKTLRYIDFLVPGIIAMTILQLGIFGTAFAIVDAKQKGILKRIMATPIAPWQYILGNMLARLVLSLTQAAILVGVATLVFDVQFHHWLWLIGLVILGNAVFLSLGLFISGVSKTTESVPVLGNLIVFPQLLLGGVFFATDSLPSWLKLIVDKLPVAVLSDLMRQTVTLDKTFMDVWPLLLVLVGWAVLALFLANTFFSMQEKE